MIADTSAALPSKTTLGIVAEVRLVEVVGSATVSTGPLHWRAIKMRGRPCRSINCLAERWHVLRLRILWLRGLANQVLTKWVAPEKRAAYRRPLFVVLVHQMAAATRPLTNTPSWTRTYRTSYKSHSAPA